MIPWLRALFLRSALVVLAGGGNVVFAAPAGHIVSVQGKGEVRQSGANDWQLARVQQDVFQGDYVRTGDLSQMAILIARDKTQIRLNQNSVMQIKTAEESAKDSQTLIRLNSGRAWSAAKTGPMPTPDSGKSASAEPPRVRMETPSATLAIRGTDWEVEVAPDGRTQLVVLSGLVEMSNDMGSVHVARGEAAVAETGKAPTKLILLNPQDRVQWVAQWRLDPGRYFSSMRGDPAVFGAALRRGDLAIARQLIPEMTPEMREIAWAALLIGEDRLAEARDLLLPLVDRVPAHFVSLLMMADIRMVEGRRDEALRMLQLAAAQNKAAIVDAQLARVLLVGDKAEAAHRVLYPDVAILATDSEIWLARGELSRFGGDREGTYAAYENAILLAPEDDRGYGGLGSAAVEREEVAAARKWLGKAIALNPGDSSYHAEAGTLEAFADNYALAEAAFNEALRLRADDYVALVGRGVMRLKQGQVDDAMSDFLAASLIEPRYARAHLYAGIAHYQNGNAGRAIESFDRAAELDPKDPLPPLYASMIHTDAFDVAAAIASARTAQERMPFLKSLNQVANNQKGVANVGNALAFAGMRDWAIAYAHDGYYPFWAGSHLFLADLYEGKFAKNSELFQGYMADPTVFGASTRQQSLIHRPGHYQTISLTVGRDDHVLEWVPRATFSGYSNATLPFAYFFDVDQQNGRAFSKEDYDYRDRTLSGTMAVGLVPRHDLRIFAYHDRDSTRASYDSARTPDLAFRSPVVNTSVGATWLPMPDNMTQIRLGRTHIEGTQTWRNSAKTTDARFFDDEVTHEGQFAWRARLNEQWELAAGVEMARNPESSGLRARVTAMGLVFFDDDSRISERTRVAYASGKYHFSPAAYFQLDLFGTRYEKRVSHNTLSGGVTTYSAREFELTRWSPRVGLVVPAASGHLVRLAYQDWVKPSSATSLGPVDTAGIVLDESALRFGGRLKRLAGKLESEWSARLFSEIGIDHKRIENFEQWDFTLADNFANLSRLRQRNVSDIAAFYAGPSNSEYSTLYLNSQARLTQLRAAVNFLVSNTWSMTAAYMNTHSKVEIQSEDWYYLPRHQTNLGLTWVSPSRWRVSGEALWRSKAWTFADLAAPRKAYWNANASAYWETPDKRYGVALFAKDLLSPHESVFYGFAANARF
ncbi:MAG: tetratricopeptide repeat protein [Rhodocyclaceae bacterium]|nr:tetratricopeptide repeat protein [Rhodocyclaceae bacterium]